MSLSVCSAVAGIGLTVVANTLKSALEGGVCIPLLLKRSLILVEARDLVLSLR